MKISNVTILLTTLVETDMNMNFGEQTLCSFKGDVEVVSLCFALRPAVFKIQGCQKLEMHRIIPERP